MKDGTYVASAGGYIDQEMFLDASEKALENMTKDELLMMEKIYCLMYEDALAAKRKRSDIIQNIQYYKAMIEVENKNA